MTTGVNTDRDAMDYACAISDCTSVDDFLAGL